MSNICIFGDSTAWGALDLEKGGWVNRLWLDCAKNQDTFVYNLSIAGGTTKTILARFESETKIRKADILVFQTGGNDAAYDKDTEKRLVSPEKFKENIEKIIQKARRLAKRIIFIGFSNCDESKTMPVSWCNLCYTNKYIKEYNGIIKKVCDTHRIKFADIFSILNNSDLEDGLHPNASGHQKIFEAVREYILQE